MEITQSNIDSLYNTITKRDTSTYTCEKCKDAEYIYDITTNTAKICNCGIAKRLYKKSGIPIALQDKVFENFKTENMPYQILSAKRASKSYVEKFNMLQSLIFSGQVGAGKTHLCIAILHELMKKGIQVAYMQYTEVINYLKQNMINDNVFQECMSKLKDVDVLYVDDLYKGRLSESDIKIMFELINHRYLNYSPTIVSSEFDLKKILKIDEAIGSRIIERAKGYIFEFEGAELNYRLRG